MNRLNLDRRANFIFINNARAFSIENLLFLILTLMIYIYCIIILNKLYNNNMYIFRDK